MSNDLELKLKIEADNANAQAKLKQTADATVDVTEKTEQAGNATIEAGNKFADFGASSISAVGGISRAIIGVLAAMVNFAQSTLGLTVRVENSSLALKSLSFIVNNFRKEITLSLGFLKTFSDYLRAIDFPIKPIIAFIDLMAQFNVVIGIGKGKTIFEDVKEAAIELADVLKTVTLADLKGDIASAAASLLVFAANTAIAFKSLQEAISRQTAFSQASRTIEGSAEQVKNLKREIDNLATTDLAVPVEELYAVAGVAGAMGKSVDDIGGFIRTVSEGVIALNIPAEQLAQKLGTLQTQFDLTEEGLISLSDQVNTVADTLPGKVAEIDIFEVLSTGVATASKNFGLLKGEAVGLTGAMLALGEAPETARIGIVNLLSGLQNAKNGTKEFQLGLGMLGTSADKLAVDIKDKPLPTLMQLLTTMNGMSNAGRLDIATKLLGKGQDAIALAKLVDNVDLLKSSINSATDATKYSGSVHAAYLQQMQTVSASTVLLKNSTSAFSESLTVEFLPAVNNVIDGLKWLVNGMTEFSNNHPVIKSVAAVSIGVMSMAGMFRLLKLAMMAVGLMSPSLIAWLGGIGSALVSLNFSIVGTIRSLYTLATTGNIFATLRTAMAFLFGGTIGLAVGAIALLVIGISKLLPITVQWGENSTTVGKMIAAMWQTILDGFDPIIESFNSGKAALDDWLVSLGIADGVVGALKNSLEFIGVVVVNTGGLFRAFGQGLGVVFANAAQSISSFAQLTEDVFSGNGIGKSLDDYKERVKNNAAELAASFKKIGEDSRNAVRDFEDGTAKNLKKDPKKLDEADKKSADNGVIPVGGVSDTAAKAAEEKIKLAKEISDREIQLIRETEAEKIRLYTATGAKKKQIDDFSFNEKLLSEQKVTAILNQNLAAELANTEKSSADKRAALIGIEQATSQQIKNLDALELEHRNKSIGYLKEIEALKKEQSANLKTLDELGLSQSEINENKRRELAANTVKIKQLLAAGEYEKAAELGKKTQDIALDFARSAREADVKANQSSSAALDARNTYNSAVDLTKQALEGASKSELKQAGIAAAEADKRRVSLDDIRGKIAAIEEATKNGVELKVTADTSHVDAAKERISKDSHSKHIITEEIVQARATGGYIALNAYAGGGNVAPPDLFPRKQGSITGKGTGTSDEIPAMLSNGEYVFTADTVSRIGVKNLDDINYGNKDPSQINANKYATGGLVGDDKLQQKVAELKKSEYENVVALFNNPANQILWSMSDGFTTVGFDATKNKMNFESKAGEYLRKNGLPSEYLSMYLKGVSADKVLSSATSSIEQKAQAQLDIEGMQNNFQGKKEGLAAESSVQQPTSAPLSVAPPTIVPAAPKMPAVSPAGFVPQVPSSSAFPIQSTSSGKVSTVKFENAAGKTTIGNSTDPNFSKFFDELNTVGGVTRT